MVIKSVNTASDKTSYFSQSKPFKYLILTHNSIKEKCQFLQWLFRLPHKLGSSPTLSPQLQHNDIQ